MKATSVSKYMNRLTTVISPVGTKKQVSARFGEVLCRLGLVVKSTRASVHSSVAYMDLVDPGRFRVAS